MPRVSVTDTSELSMNGAVRNTAEICVARSGQSRLTYVAGTPFSSVRTGSSREKSPTVSEAARF